MKRTSQIKDELFNIDYVPEDRKTSVRGKTYRMIRDKLKNINS
jgi:hypothetical protein